MTDGILCFSVPADLQSAGLEFGDLQSPKLLFLHHLVRKALPVLQRDFHQVLPRRKAIHIETVEILILCMYQVTLQVVELDLFGLHVGRVLQVELVLGGVGVVNVGAKERICLG